MSLTKTAVGRTGRVRIVPAGLTRALGIPRGAKISDDNLKRALTSKKPKVRAWARLARTIQGTNK